MTVANDFPMGDETACAGCRHIQITKVVEPTEGEGSRGRKRNRHHDRKSKEDPNSELVAATKGTGQAGNKKSKWEDRLRRPSCSYEDVMSGPCRYHIHGAFQANHSTRECPLNDQLTQENNAKAIAKGSSDDDSGSPAPQVRARPQARNNRRGGWQATWKEIKEVNMIFRCPESKRVQK